MPSTSVPVNILDLTASGLLDYLKLLGEPASGAGQLLKAIFQEYTGSFDEMSGLSPSLREKLAQCATLGTLEPLDEKVSADAQTRKVLFRLEDGRTIESALMFYRNPGTGRERRTVCISSQVGCAVGCRFCATGQQGFERNLSPGEIISQVLFFLRRYREEVSGPGERPGGAG